MDVEQWTDEEWKQFEAKLDGIDYPKEINNKYVADVNELIQQTRGQDEHPEWYDSPCICNLCLSYGD
jgi:hypothetical protein